MKPSLIILGVLIWFLFLYLLVIIFEDPPLEGYSITNRREAEMPNYAAMEEEALQARGTLLQATVGPLATLLDQPKER